MITSETTFRPFDQTQAIIVIDIAINGSNINMLYKMIIRYRYVCNCEWTGTVSSTRTSEALFAGDVLVLVITLQTSVTRFTVMVMITMVIMIIIMIIIIRK